MWWKWSLGSFLLLLMGVTFDSYARDVPPPPPEVAITPPSPSETIPQQPPVMQEEKTATHTVRAGGLEVGRLAFMDSSSWNLQIWARHEHALLVFEWSVQEGGPLQLVIRDANSILVRQVGVGTQVWAGSLMMKMIKQVQLSGQATLPWWKNLSFTVAPYGPQKSQLIPTQRLEAAWLGRLGQASTEGAVTLEQTLKSCFQRMKFLHQQVVNQAPDIAYTAYAQVVQLSRLCENLGDSLKFAHKNNNSKDMVAQAFQKVLTEAKEELPPSLAFSTETWIFSRSELSPLWFWAANDVIQDSVAETQHQVDFNILKKIRITFVASVSRLGSRAVMRAELQRLSSSIKVTPTTTPLTKGSVPIFRGPSSLWGLTEEALSEACTKGQGQVVFDVQNDAPTVQSAFTLNHFTPWDEGGRLDALTRALQLSLATAGCVQMQVLAAPAFFPVVNKYLNETFNPLWLHPSLEFAISNKNPKDFQILPGRYRMTLRSVVSGNVLGVQEFEVQKPSTVVNIRI